MTSRLFAYAQLVRLPNVFTAIADVMMGYLVTRGSLEPWYLFALVVGTTVFLYWSGMVLNDRFDVEADRRERPERPIPSGRVSLNEAHYLGFGLMAAGIGVAGLAAGLAGTLRPVWWAGILAICVTLYDTWAKHNSIGPIVMGACRTANVLIGMSLAVDTIGGPLRNLQTFEWMLAIAIGVYITGFTWFARSEADTSERASLVGGLTVALCGLAVIGSLPLWTEFPFAPSIRPQGWYVLWTFVALIISRRCLLAIVDPSPGRVQAAVKNGILSLIIIDAAITLAVCGVFWGCAILLLLAPALLVGRWFYST